MKYVGNCAMAFVRGSAKLALGAGVSLGAMLFAAGQVRAIEIQEPTVISSVNGVMDLLMIAQAGTMTTLTPQQPQGFFYNICRRPADGSEDCPPLPAGTNPYNAMRLELQGGDKVKVHFVNKLPPLTDSKHAQDPGDAWLAMNPSNIHWHGLLVSPHYPTRADPTYGDVIFVITFNAANGTPPSFAGVHADVRMNSTDYAFVVPPSHPSGMAWVHPHIHGVTLNQLEAGMESMVTVGSVNDYVCTGPQCATFAKNLTVRHMTIKDMQVLADGTRQDQPDPGMCINPATGGLVTPALQGYCAGQDFTGGVGGGPNYTGGKWFVSLNGQPYPTVTVKSSAGEVWRVLNAAGSMTQNVTLHNNTTNANMVFQILALDGVSLDSTINPGGSARYHQVQCPGVTVSGAETPVCADRIMMMPSSRAELWVTYRDAKGNVTAPPANAQAILRTVGYNSGPAGDTWPAVDLAQVAFQQPAAANAPNHLSVIGPKASLTSPLQIAQDLNQANANVGVTMSLCRPLAAGHHRRIYFNVPDGAPAFFGVGYEEVDHNGNTVPGTYRPVSQFNINAPTVCMPLGAHNTAVTETWELVNLSGEDHNFHIHQVKFSVVSMPAQNGTNIPGQGATTATVDNVPLLRASGGSSTVSEGGCASPDEWKSGVCKSTPTVVKIPFFIAGDFVYHCHIIEHEDGGMMARIRVLPNP